MISTAASPAPCHRLQVQNFDSETAPKTSMPESSEFRKSCGSESDVINCFSSSEMEEDTFLVLV